MKHWLKAIAITLVLFAAVGLALNLAGCGSNLADARKDMETSRAVAVQQLADAELAGDEARANKLRGIIEGLDKGLLLVNEDGSLSFTEVAGFLPPPWDWVVSIGGPLLGGLIGFGGAKKLAAKKTKTT